MWRKTKPTATVGGLGWETNILVFLGTGGLPQLRDFSGKMGKVQANGNKLVT